MNHESCPLFQCSHRCHLTWRNAGLESGGISLPLDKPYTIEQFVNMKTTTLSTRLPPEEVRSLDELARQRGLDRSSMVKALLRRGLRETQIETAFEAFAKEEVTLSRAAEMAGLSVRDFVARMDEHRVLLHYDVDDLEEDLAPGSSQ